MFIGYETYGQYHRIHETQKLIVLNESRSLAKFITAFRQTYMGVFVNNNIDIGEQTIKLLPVKTLPAISDKFSSSVLDDVVIRTVSDRPRNIKNTANDFEMEMIHYFRENPQAKDKFIQKDDMYYYTKPLMIEPICLSCHGKRENAIPAIRDRYENAYDYKLGEIRGLLNIQIKEHDFVRAVYSEFKTSSSSLMLLSIAFLGTLLYMILKIRKKDQQYAKRLEEDIEEKIYEINKQKDILYHQAHHDALTGLPNRTLFADRLNHAIEVVKRHKASLALLFIDIDNFKNINDTFGHDVGDKVLVEVANRFKGSIRSNDTLARLGGDEFTIIIEDLKSVDEVPAVVAKVQKSLNAPINIDKNVFHVSCSIGISLYPQDDIELNSLMKHADVAMYKAKDKGKDNFQFYTQPTS